MRLIGELQSNYFRSTKGYPRIAKTYGNGVRSRGCGETNAIVVIIVISNNMQPPVPNIEQVGTQSTLSKDKVNRKRINSLSGG